MTNINTTTLVNDLLPQHQYRLVSVTSTTSFPDNEGWVVFGYGYDYQTKPVRYLGKTGNNTILIDPEFTFINKIPVGSIVNMLLDNNSFNPKNNQLGSFILTDTPAGRVAAESAIDSIFAAGYTINHTVTYPGDIGLGWGGRPKKGVNNISDIVQCFCGNDVDKERAEAREGY